MMYTVKNLGQIEENLTNMHFLAHKQLKKPTISFIMLSIHMQ